jgi:hypothetical protein
LSGAEGRVSTVATFGGKNDDREKPAMQQQPARQRQSTSRARLDDPLAASWAQMDEPLARLYASRETVGQNRMVLTQFPITSGLPTIRELLDSVKTSAFSGSNLDNRA